MARLAYFDSSVVLKLILDESGSEAAEGILKSVTEAGYELVSSALLDVEIHRVGFLADLDRAITESVVGLFYLVEVSETILSRASSIQHHVKTLDAIHISTAAELAGGDELVLVTHDRSMLSVSSALGIRTRSLTDTKQSVPAS